MVRRNVNVPMYTPRIPIRGGGGVIDLSSKENETKMLLAQAIGEALGQIYGPGKRQRQTRRQISQVSPVLSREGDRATNIRDALAAIQAEERPTGFGGVLDFLNPLAPARGGGSEVEQYLTEQAMQQPKQPSGRIVVGGGKTWLVDPQTGEKRDLGIPSPKSKVGERKISDIINDISKISTLQEKDVIGGEYTGAMTDPLFQALAGKLGLEDVEIEEPSTERTWGWPTLTKPAYRVRPERTKTRKVLRKKKITMPPAAKVERHLVRKAKERPPKPKEYPDAVWSEEHQMWTIVKNGRLMGVK